MTCEEAQLQYLAARYEMADGAAATGPSHMLTCPSCQAFIAQHRALDAVLSQDANGSPGPGFDRRFFARLKDLQQKPSRRRVWAWSAGLAAATAAMLAVALWQHPVAPPDNVAGAAGELALAMDLDMLQEDVHMLSQLDDVEDFVILQHLPPDALDEVRRE